MKADRFLLLLAVLPMTAQSHRPRVQKIDATPLTARPQGATALSTAQMGGARDGLRLHSLPALAVTEMGGTAVQLESLPHLDYWLLMYRGETCHPCDQVMEVLAKQGNEAMRLGTGLFVLVDPGRPTVQASADDLNDLRSKYATMTATTWLVDRQGAAIAALKPHGQPTLYALHGSTIAWSAPGRLGDGKTLAALASSWIAHNPPPARTGTTPVAESK